MIVKNHTMWVWIFCDSEQVSLCARIVQSKDEKRRKTENDADQSRSAEKNGKERRKKLKPKQATMKAECIILD